MTPRELHEMEGHYWLYGQWALRHDVRITIADGLVNIIAGDSVFSIERCSTSVAYWPLLRAFFRLPRECARVVGRLLS